MNDWNTLRMFEGVDFSTLKLGLWKDGSVPLVMYRTVYSWYAKNYSDHQSTCGPKAFREMSGGPRFLDFRSLGPKFLE